VLTAQLTISDAIEAGQRGMAQAEDGAGHGFAEQADRFVANFARFAELPFSSEEVTDLAAACGLSTWDARAWGGVFQRAARAGVIKRSGEMYRRRYGNGSIGVKWERAQ